MKHIIITFLSGLFIALALIFTLAIASFLGDKEQYATDYHNPDIQQDEYGNRLYSLDHPFPLTENSNDGSFTVVSQFGETIIKEQPQ